MNEYHSVIREDARDFLRSIDAKDRGKIYMQIESMETGDFSGLLVKTVQYPLRELKVKRYRMLFFIHRDKILMISGFIKKSQKTPRKEILKAQKIISLFLQTS